MKELVSKEILKLLEAGIIYPVADSDWVSHVHSVLKKGGCRCQNQRISGRGSRIVRLRLVVTGGGGHNVYPSSGPLYIGNTLRLIDLDEYEYYKS